MKILITLLILFCSNALAKVQLDKCVGLSGDVGITVYNSILNDMGLEKSDIDKSKTSIKVVESYPVTHALSLMYGREEVKLSGVNSEDKTTAEEYAKGFMEDNSKNYIIRYNFKNKDNKQIIVLSSVFISDETCIVRYNGYISIDKQF